MNKAQLLTKISIIIGTLGLLAFLLAWSAELKGFVLGFESRHWYSDAMVLMLAAIWFKLGAIYHQRERSGISRDMQL